MTKLSCVLCDKTFRLEENRTDCPCGGLLDVSHDFSGFPPDGPGLFRQRRREPGNSADQSGVWRFREFVLPDLAAGDLVTRQEGNTRLYSFPRTGRWLGHDGVRFKHEGENPTGSFKDRGLTAAVSWAKHRGAQCVACASTGNTAAAVASYASLAGLPAVILISEKGTAMGKVAQAMAYGALTVMVRGDFDAALKLLLQCRDPLGLTVLNSVNPFRLEGQKTIIWEALEQYGWESPPDWIVVPGGNLGNTSAFGKALKEAHDLGWISKMPRLAVIQAAGANPFYLGSQAGWERQTVSAETVATAIKIGDPVNYDKAVRSLRWTDGVVEEVSDEEIMEAKAVIDSDGVGAEPASCASAAGVRKLVRNGVIRPDQKVLAILTGHFLKDPDVTIGYHSGNLEGFSCSMANRPTLIDPTPEALKKALAERG